MPRRSSLGGAADHSAERVKVVVRVRPPRGSETGGAISVAPDNKGIVLYRDQSNVPQSGFEFDKVLREDASQADVFHAAVQPIVGDVMNGYNGTIMAYGQTGAGKTYTLSSVAPDNIGMMPRAAAAIFSEIEHDSSNVYTVVMSYIQIYMELLQDLLQPQNNDLQIREGEDGVFVAGVHEVEVKKVEDCLHLLQVGDRNRVFAFTALNAHSSRSHAIVMLTITKRPAAAPQNRALGQKVKVGKLFLVDLAGSERLKKSRSTGLRASEAVSINLSLTTLGMCINARADPNATHVPFRDSKLTRLLQESLGGNAKTSLVIAVANALQHVDETLQSLQFGSRAMRAVVNEHVDFKVMNAELVAALDKREDKAHLLEATLMAKEEELETLGSLQQEERMRNRQIMETLEREKSELANEHGKLASMLSQTQAEAEDMASRHARQKAELEAALRKALEKLSQSKQEHAEAQLAHEQEVQRLQRAHRESLDSLNQQHRAAVQRQDAQLHSLTEQHQQKLYDLDRQAYALPRELDTFHPPCLQHAEDLRARAEAQLHAEEQHAALMAATAAQHASQLQALQDKHAAEQQESARRSSAERDSAAERHRAELAEATRRADARCAGMAQEHARMLQDAARQAESQLQRLTQTHELEQERLKQQLEMERDGTVHVLQLEIKDLQQQLRLAEQAGAEARADNARLRQEQQEDSRATEERWRQRLAESEAAAAAKLGRERELVAQYEGTITELSQDVAGLTRDVQRMRDHSSALESEVEALKGDLENQQEAQQRMKGRLVKEQQALAGMQRSRQAFLAVWEASRRRSRAARIIQRHFRAYRVARLIARTDMDAKALEAAESERWMLEGQKARVEAEQRRHLAWSGRELVGSSLGLMEEAVDQIRAAFLLPKKELKSLDAFKKMFTAPASPMAPLRPRSAKGSPRWTIRAASFSGINGGGGRSRLFISPSTSPTGTPRGPPSGPPSRSISRLASDALAQAAEQLAPPEATQSPERRVKEERERSIIARISAAESGAQEVGPRVHSGPLSMGLSLSNPDLPPLRPVNGKVGSPKMLSPEAASFRSPMQFGLSRMEDAHAGSAAVPKEAAVPRLRVPSRPSASRGAAVNATKAWGTPRADSK
ncbi:probable Kinesin heavy chain at N-terminal half [Coccomyxa sp. Obi]|nr:probable Kinesin heavy chain at N-terminal half [Coccomyxa sp. Obi]